MLPCIKECWDATRWGSSRLLEDRFAHFEPRFCDVIIAKKGSVANSAFSTAAKEDSRWWRHAWCFAVAKCPNLVSSNFGGSYFFIWNPNESNFRMLSTGARSKSTRWSLPVATRDDSSRRFFGLRSGQAYGSRVELGLARIPLLGPTVRGLLYYITLLAEIPDKFEEIARKRIRSPQQIELLEVPLYSRLPTVLWFWCQSWRAQKCQQWDSSSKGLVCFYSLTGVISPWRRTLPSVGFVIFFVVSLNGLDRVMDAEGGPADVYPVGVSTETDDLGSWCTTSDSRLRSSATRMTTAVAKTEAQMGKSWDACLNELHPSPWLQLMKW